ncbi:MAG: DUF4860 domain-containing protein [Lachnospiraceae bacterium]|nr:DUF4860 domain-containing protein [Lachnospiraceae bacterium]MBR1669121.1 DUF4860 domain-containing protein [Butyrivibrio sp.]
MELDKKSSHTIDAVFVIALLLLFMLSALSVIAIGASIYKKNVEKMSENSSHRIACAYLTEKVRQADENGAIDVERIFGENALVFSEDINGVTYKTYIYDFDGNLMELYARDDMGVFYPRSGQKITPVVSFDIQKVSDNMFDVLFILPDGNEERLFVTKRSEKAG